jgi:DNA-binding transcriptional ArsR family regulator
VFVARALGGAASDYGGVSRGPGRIQRALLAHLLGEDAPVGPFAGEPGFEPVSALARRVFGVVEPTDSQRASVRRALRSLAERGLVELERGPNGRTYGQRRRRRTRYLAACSGRDCEWCETTVRHRHPSTLVLEQLREISPTPDRDVADAREFGFHEWRGSEWTDFTLEPHRVDVTELHARRKPTAAETAAVDAAIGARIARAVRSAGGAADTARSE